MNPLLKRAGIGLSSALLLLSPAEGAPSVEARTLAEEAFASVNARFQSVPVLRYRVERKTVARGVTLVEKWAFACSTQGLVRVDYTFPEKRVFLADGTNLTEYLPAARKALRTPMTGTNAAAAARVSTVFQRLAVDGLRVGDYGNLLDHLSSAAPAPDQPAVLVVEGTDPRYRVRIDTERRILLDFEKWDAQGRLELSIRAGGFLEAAPGFWMPSRVRTQVAEGEERVERETALSEVKVQEQAGFIFDFTLPADVAILSGN